MSAPRPTPGLHLHTSNRLETLVEALAEVTCAPLSSPFRAETIVVQSQGMARWLKQRLADAHGVCAHMSFPFPNEMASNLFLAAFPELPAKPPFDREVMLWLVMKHLPALLGKPAFEDPRRYLGDRSDLRKQHQLARKVAYLFDQYFIFRPELIRSWDLGGDTHWQAELWRRIRPEIPHRHPAELQEQFVRLLQQPGADVSRLPERLCIFGVSALPPFHLELVTKLGAHLSVHLFVVQPSREYWGDITSGREEARLLRRHGHEPGVAAALHLERGNRLLASLGPLGRDFLKLIYDSADWQEDDDFTEPEGNTLLERVQSDILNLRDHAGTAPHLPESGNDLDAVRALDSLQFHSCHSPLREMEVLHDHMLEWFNRDPSLTPRDIIVMSPDIETHAPFIEAVFGSPEDESRRIPFRIADRGASTSNQIVRAFLNLLRLPQTRLGAATVLALLESRAVRERFALSESDLELVRHWVEETGIRWGADAGHRAHLGLPALPGNTWREGLDRLLLGYAMSGRGEMLFDGIAPFDDLEGGSALVLGRLAEFIGRLFETVNDLGRPRRIDAWAVRLHRVLDDFFQPDEEHEHEAQTIRAALRNLRRQHDHSQFNVDIDLGVLLEHLMPELEEDSHGTGFLSGGVTFCALKPMRSIPFKVICLVGMNDAAFPRPNVHLSFDLMARAPRLGDRSTRHDDRYLFLETILSARHRLYLSYVGQSIRDNSPIPPSVVVSELLDCLEQHFGLAREQLVSRHRLQAFHESYFMPDGRLFSYSGENCRASQSVRRPELIQAPFVSTPLPEPGPELRRVTLDDLARFLCNPCAFLLQHRMGIRLRKTDGALDEREPFDLSARDAYPLKQRLLEAKVDGPGTGQPFAHITAAGVLPLGEPGRARGQSLVASVESLWQRLRPFEPQRAGALLDVDFAPADFRLTGRVSTRPAGGVLNYRAAVVKAQDILRHWVQHLAACAGGREGESVLVGVDAAHRYRPCENAAATLAGLLDLYWRGLRQPLKFFPRSSRTFAEAELKRETTEKSESDPLTEALKEWEGNRFRSMPAERDDPSFELCFGEEPPFDDEFAALARQVFGPVLEHETVEEA